MILAPGFQSFNPSVYDTEDEPRVAPENGALHVTVTDPILKRPLALSVDLVVLATAIVPDSNDPLAQFFKVPVNEDGFFVEAHAKLGPVEIATDAFRGQRQFGAAVPHQQMAQDRCLDEPIDPGVAFAIAPVRFVLQSGPHGPFSGWVVHPATPFSHCVVSRLVRTGRCAGKPASHQPAPVACRRRARHALPQRSPMFEHPSQWFRRMVVTPPSLFRPALQRCLVYTVRNSVYAVVNGISHNGNNRDRRSAWVP